MKRTLIFTLILFGFTVNAKVAHEGEAHYLKANCQKCHLQGEKFDPNSINKEGLTSKVKNRSDLKKWVSSCDSFFNVGWFPQEQEEVIEYLNKSHYKF